MSTEKQAVLDGGLRYNSGKLRWSLLSVAALTELIKVLEFGAKKYDSWNWSKGLSFTDTYDSLIRHLNAWMRGEDKDPETGLSHIAHVMCNAMFLLHFIVTGSGRDDRPSAQRDPYNDKQKEYYALTGSKLDNIAKPLAPWYTPVPVPINPVEHGGLSNLQADLRTTATGWGDGRMAGNDCTNYRCK